jgi:protein ImuB
LADVAREFSPRIEINTPREVVLDLSGLTRLFGDARTIAEHLRGTAADRGVRVRVAIAGTGAAARLLVRHRAGLTVVEPGTEAAALAPLPIALLGALAGVNSQLPPLDSARGGLSDGRRPTPNFQKERARRHLGVGNWELEVGSTLRRWGLRTLGDLAALPSDEVASRLGHDGTELQRLARGEDPRPLVPAVPEERFEQSLELEWPIVEIEPLSFVLGRLMEPLSAHLEQRDRGAAVLHVRLDLVKAAGAARNVFERSLQLPFPIRDARTLRTLALLDLESHPPPAAIDRVTVAVDPTPARIVQWSLLSRSLPSPEHMSTLMARLQALMGETRCGSPVVVDSWQPGVFAMKPFAPQDSNAIHEPRRHGGTVSPWPVGTRDGNPVVALRRFRHPVPVRVQAEHGRPSSLMTMQRGLSGGRVEVCAGPWRTSGGWWGSGIRDQGSGIKTDPGSPIPNPAPSWDRDEWDVALTGGAAYRLLRERNTNRWFIEGIVD